MHAAASFGDHPLVERFDAVTAGVLKRERQKGVEKTGDGADEHAKGKSTRGTEVLQVGLADRGWMFSEETPHSHAFSLGKTACHSVSYCTAGRTPA